MRRVALVAILFAGCYELRPYRNGWVKMDSKTVMESPDAVFLVRLSGASAETISTETSGQTSVRVTPGMIRGHDDVSSRNVNSRAEADFLVGQVETHLARLGLHVVRQGEHSVEVTLNVGALRLGSDEYAGWVTDRMRLEFRDARTGELLASMDGRGSVVPYHAENMLEWMLDAYREKK